MTNESSPPLAIGRNRTRYLALRFGAPDDRPTPDDIADTFDRARCLARINFENARLKIWRNAAVRWFGWRAKAAPYIERQVAQFETDARRECQFPALVRGRGFVGLLPFGDDGHAVQEIAERWVSGVPHRDAKTVPPAADVAKARERYTVLNRHRLAFLCLHIGGRGETPESVPADRLDEFQELCGFHIQDRIKAYEDICREFASRTGFFDDIPARMQVGALNFLNLKAAFFENACKYELEIERIDRRKKAVVSLKDVTTADLLAD